MQKVKIEIETTNNAFIGMEWREVQRILDNIPHRDIKGTTKLLDFNGNECGKITIT